MALHTLGPRLDIAISMPAPLASALVAQGATVPQPSVGHALIDTGAAQTCIEDSVARQLGLPVINQVPLSTPAGQTMHTLYAAQLIFPGTLLPTITNIAVIGVHLSSQGIAALLGRDFLSGKTLHYDGGLSIVSLSW